MADTTEVRFPEVTVQLTGEDGNAFAIMGAVQKGLRRGGATPEQVKECLDEMSSGDYDNLLRTAMAWVNVE